MIADLAGAAVRDICVRDTPVQLTTSFYAERYATSANLVPAVFTQSHDMYGLGLMLIELLGGAQVQSLFDGEDALRATHFNYVPRLAVPLLIHTPRLSPFFPPLPCSNV